MGESSVVVRPSGKSVIKIGAVLALLVVICGLAFPSLVVVLFVAALVACLAVRWPLAAVGVSLVAITLSPTLGRVWPGSSLSYLDEAVVFALVAILVPRALILYGRVQVPGWSMTLLGFVFFGLVSSVVRDVPFGVTAEAAFLALKGACFGFALAQIRWRQSDLRPFVVGGGIAIMVIFLATAVNALAPDAWESFLFRTVKVDYENGIPALVGPFLHPASLGRMSALLATAVLVYVIHVSRGWRAMVLFAMAAAPAVVSLRLKSMVSLLVSGAAVVAHGLIGRVKRSVLIGAGAGGLLLSIPLALAAWSDFALYFLGVSARSRLTQGSIEVANGYFPLGAGFGRFGSSTAASNYSPEYVELGFSDIYGVGIAPGRGIYLNDTQWPAILGEAGWLGAAFFAIALLLMLRGFLLLARKQSIPIIRWAAITGAAWWAVIMIESVAAPVLTSAPAFPFLFGMAGVCHALNRRPSSAVDPATVPTSSRKPARKMLLVASAGGHIAQLVRLAPGLGASEDSVWVTFRSPQTESLLRGRRVVYVPYIRPRGWIGVLRATGVVWRILRAERFELAVSTGAAIALSALPLARLRGTRALYIESVSRVTGPSLTGHVIAASHCAELRTQHAEWASRRWVKTAGVFASYLPMQGPVQERPRLFVTLGTIEGFRFDALLDRVLASGLADDRTVWQTGFTTGRSDLPGTVRSQVSASEFEDYARAADVVITHAGVGSLLTLLELGISPLLVTRRKHRGEHVDDHQRQIGELAASLGVATVVDAPDLSAHHIVEASRRRVEPAERADWLG